MPINSRGKYVPKKYAVRGRPQRLYSTEPCMCSVVSLLKNAQGEAEVDWAIKFAYHAVMKEGWCPNKQTLVKWYHAISDAMCRVYPDGLHTASPEETLFIDYYFSFTMGSTIFVDRLNAATTQKEFVDALDTTVNVSQFFPATLQELYNEALIRGIVRLDMPGARFYKKMFPEYFPEKTQPERIIEGLVELKDAVVLQKSVDVAKENDCVNEVIEIPQPQENQA